MTFTLRNEANYFLFLRFTASHGISINILLLGFTVSIIIMCFMFIIPIQIESWVSYIIEFYNSYGQAIHPMGIGRSSRTFPS